MVKFVNLTPHAINLPEGRVLPPSGKVARVKDAFTEFDADGVCTVSYGPVEGLPAYTDVSEDTLYVVSALVLAAGKLQGRTDLVAPATGHPLAKRNDKGQVIEVPGFVR